MARSIDIVVPDLGDFENVEIIELLVAKGDRVEKDDGLITLETDKASMDVPAPEDGVVRSLSVSVGDKVSAGDVIGTLDPGEGRDAGETEEAGEDAAPGPAAGDDAEPAKAGRDDADEQKPGDDETESETTGSGGQQRLVVPDIGDFEDVEIIEVLVSEGDEVGEGDSLVTLETDKASMDVPATRAGRIVALEVAVGDRVSAGDVIAVIEAASRAAQPAGKATGPAEKPRARENETRAEEEREPAGDAGKAREKQEPAADAPKAGTAGRLPAVEEAGFAKAHASPSVRKLARELGVDLGQVEGSGPKGRVLHDDVKGWVKRMLSGAGGAPQAAAALPKTPSVDFSKFGETETEPLTRIQRIAGPRLAASWINLPHVTQHDLADITDLEKRRQELKEAASERGIRLTPLAFVMKACVTALREFPKVNASLADDGKNLVIKKYIHLGFAADTEDGLVVPVIRDADKKDIYELARELAELSAAARDGKLKAPQLQGASFTISSLGGIGGTAFTPIVNAPEVAILGVSRSTMQPVWNGERFEPRLMLPLSLSYDHRVIDGALAVRFTTFLGKTLADVESLLEAIP